MAKSIKLKDNTYWDYSAIRYGVARKTFEIGAGSSVTLTFSGTELVFLLSGKTTLGAGKVFWIVFTYGAGGTDRTAIRKIEDGGSHITSTINEKTIKLTNNSQKYKCSILMLVGSPNDVTIS